MKLNNKGYAITIIVFGILVVFIIVLSSLLVTMNNSVKLNKTVKEDVIENIQLNADTTGMSLTERIVQLEINQTQMNEKLSNVKKETINEIYPVGSIYISATDATIDAVTARFGGEWEVYAQGRTLIGVGSTTDDNGNALVYENNATGGSSLTTLSVENLPSHSHGIPALSGSTNTTGEHSHNFTYRGSQYAKWSISSTAGSYLTFYGGDNSLDINTYGVGIASAGNHAHTVTTNANNTGNAGSGTSFSLQNPYITVYMYKRIK